MKKIVIGIIGLLVVIVGLFTYSSESIPKSKAEIQQDTISAGDRLAKKMFKAINKQAWDDIHYVQWSFRGKHHFVWDKYKHLVQVSWKEYVVLINPNTSEGVAYEDSKKIEGEEADKLIEKAINAFNNDSFWLNAPAKAFDNGTERSVVDFEGKDALMVKYNSGGSTPGDSYLWILDDKGLPRAWKMWVSIIPVGGIEFSWEEWAEFDGAMLSQLHDGNVFDLRISNIKTGAQLVDLGLEKDLFDELED
jgi:uncharacterized protein YxeA